MINAQIPMPIATVTIDKNGTTPLQVSFGTVILIFSYVFDAAMVLNHQIFKVVTSKT